MLFESQKCSIIIRFFSLLVINVINYYTQGYDVKLIANYCQLSSKATPMGHLVYTVESSLLSEHMGRYCSHHQEPKVWISRIHQIPLQQDPTEPLSPLLEKAEHDMIAPAFKYTWDQNNYSEAFGEGKVIPGSLLLGSLKHHVPNPSHTDPEGAKFRVAWRAAGFLLEKPLTSSEKHAFNLSTLILY